MSKIVKIDLSSGAVCTVLIDGKPHVVIRPAIEELGLSYPRQYRKLKGRSWAVVAQAATTGADGKTYQMDVVPLRTFLMLLATVNENRVAEHARPTLVAFQNETADAIEAYWARGLAQDPEAGLLSWEHVAALARAEYGMNMTVGDLRGLLRSAGILTLTGRPHVRWERMFRPSPAATRWDVYPAAVAWLIHVAHKEQAAIARGNGQAQLELPGVRASLRAIDGGVA